MKYRSPGPKRKNSFSDYFLDFLWIMAIGLYIFTAICFVVTINESDKKQHNYLLENVISPTVKITTDGEGTGVIVKKEKIIEDEEKGLSYFNDRFKYYILTAKHIPENGYLNIISFVDDTNTIYNVELANIYAFSEQDDILILELESNLDMGEEVLIPDDDIEKTIKIGTEVFSYGCQNGFYPALTSGIISQFDKKGNILASAPLTPGVSGSGLFIKDHDKYYLIGMATKIAYLNGYTPIYHMGMFISLDKIKKLLKNNKI